MLFMSSCGHCAAPEQASGAQSTSHEHANLHRGSTHDAEPVQWIAHAAPAHVTTPHVCSAAHVSVHGPSVHLRLAHAPGPPQSASQPPAHATVAHESCASHTSETEAPIASIERLPHDVPASHSTWQPAGLSGHTTIAAPVLAASPQLFGPLQTTSQLVD